MFKLGSIEFGISHAILSGIFMDSAMSKRMQSTGVAEFHWVIEIDMNEGDFITGLSEDDLENDEEIFYESVAPRLYHNNGFSMDLKSWKNIEGNSLIWNSRYNSSGEEAGSLYVFEHEAVTAGTIEFIKRNGKMILTRWTGTANVYWNDEYSEDVPFTFEGEVEFIGVTAHCDSISSKAELEIAMADFIHVDEYECISNDTRKIITGSSCIWKFAPVNFDK